MVRRTGPTNIVLRTLIRDLKKQSRKYKAPIWRYVAELLSKPSRQRVVVNLSKINRYAEDGDVIVVPGKVLAAGNLEKKVTIAAFSASKKAVEKVKLAGGNIISIWDLMEMNPKGSSVKVMM